MFKLPGIPSPRSNRDELADFAEWVALKQRSVSAREIQAALGRLDENDDNEGCDDNSDDLSDFMDEVMNQLEMRAAACGEAYPFQLNRPGTSLHRLDTLEHPGQLVYRFLLLATRLDMGTNRIHDDVDGADLFEHLSAHILANYLGGPGRVSYETEHNILQKNRACSWVFGTGTSGKFEDKVQLLCNLTDEGGGYSNQYGGEHSSKDDKLDIVAWVPFRDRCSSQLMLFAQCKTGSNWKSQVSQIQPDAFGSKWMLRQFVVYPMRVFLVADCLDRTSWGRLQVDAGLFFDRCRIVDFCDDLPEHLLEKIDRWCNAAVTAIS